MAPRELQDSTKSALDSLSERVYHATSTSINRTQNLVEKTTTTGVTYLDRVVSPQQRKVLVDKAQAFVAQNPKLSAFLLLNLALTGPPLIFFFLFSLSTLIFSFLTFLTLAFIATISFSFFVIGLTSLFILPVIFLTTVTAVGFFVAGLTAFYFLRWLNLRRDGRNSSTTKSESKEENWLSAGMGSFSAPKKTAESPQVTDETAKSKIQVNGNGADQRNGMKKGDELETAWKNSSSKPSQTATSSAEVDAPTGVIAL